MSDNEIREPVQKRSIEKKEKIIKAGFDLICEKGYYNTNTAEIAKKAGVSTGIVYQYFKDKHDILIAGIQKYASDIFYPMLNTVTTEVDLSPQNFRDVLKNMINRFIENHKLSQSAHQEIMAMTHSDEDIAHFFQEHKIYMTDTIVKLLQSHGICSENLPEKVHISINLIDDLCHEIVYHKHKCMNYDVMIDLVVDTIVGLIK